MSVLGCGLWWFVAGVLVGWLLWQLFDKLYRRDGQAAGQRLQLDLDEANGRVSLLQRELHAWRSGQAVPGGEAAGPSTLAEGPDPRLLSLSDELKGLRVLLGERDVELARLRADLAQDRRPADEVPPPADRKPAAAPRSDRTGTAATRSERASAKSEPPIDDLFSQPPWQDDTAPAAAAMPAPVGPREPLAVGRDTTARRADGSDNLLIIEGIGPKIVEVLIEAGIGSFEQLAATPVERLQGILDDAGPHFRLARPASWPRQAAICVSGDLEALRQYQQQLIAGVDPQAPKA